MDESPPWSEVRSVTSAGPISRTHLCPPWTGRLPSWSRCAAYRRGPVHRNAQLGNCRSSLLLSYVTFGGCWWLGGYWAMQKGPRICCGSPLRCWPMAGSWAFQGRVLLVFGGALDNQKSYRDRGFRYWVGCRMYPNARNSKKATIRQEISVLSMLTLIRQHLFGGGRVMLAMSFLYAWLWEQPLFISKSRAVGRL